MVVIYWHAHPTLGWELLLQDVGGGMRLPVRRLNMHLRLPPVDLTDDDTATPVGVGDKLRQAITAGVVSDLLKLREKRCWVHDY